MQIVLITCVSMLAYACHLALTAAANTINNTEMRLKTMSNVVASIVKSRVFEGACKHATYERELCRHIVVYV